MQHDSEQEPHSTPREPGAAHGPPPARRELLKGSLAAAVAAGLPSAEPQDADGVREELFLAEEHWRDRMKAPDDGKKYGWVIDSRRCFGCHACEVACKSENDVSLGSFIRQTIYHDRERANGQQARVMIPMACQHCEDAPCIKACPCGAMHKGPGGTVQVNYDKCSGHATCKDACPYGAIYIDPVANQAVKCHNCTHRLDEGMAPACETTCPSDAIHFGDLNDPESRASKLLARIEAEEGAVAERVREKKGTEPRMWFVGNDEHRVEHWESKIPGEGQSYHPDAYSVYEWKESTPPHDRVPHPVDEQLAANEASNQEGEDANQGGQR